MLRLTITTGCFLMQAVSSTTFMPEQLSTIALIGGVAAGVMSALPTAWKLTDRFFEGQEMVEAGQ